MYCTESDCPTMTSYEDVAKASELKCLRRHTMPPSSQKRQSSSGVVVNNIANSPTRRSFQRNKQPTSPKRPAPTTSTAVSSPSFLSRFIYLFVVVVFVRTIWNSILVTRNWQTPTNLGILDFPSVMQQHHYQSSRLSSTTTPSSPSTMMRGPMTRRISSSYKRKPRRPKKIDQEAIELPPLAVTIKRQDQVLTIIDSLNQEGMMSWVTLCHGKPNKNDGDHHHHPLDSTSRVLISGILTHPVASELVFALLDKCGVDLVTGIDIGGLGPESASRYAFSLRQFPPNKLHIIRTQYPMTLPKLEKIFDLLIPTHIIHLEPNSFRSVSPLFIEEEADSSNSSWPDGIAVRTSIDILERYCNLSLKHQYYQPDHPIALLHVISNSSSFTSKGNGNLISKALDSLYPIILQTYKERYGVNVAQLKLPEMYGPFNEGSTWMTDTFLHKMRSQANSTSANNATKTWKTLTARVDHEYQNSHGPFLHVNDAVFSIIESLRRQELFVGDSSSSSLTAFVPPESLYVSMDEIQQAVIELYSQLAKGIVAMRVSFILSWRHKVKRQPYYGWAYHHEKDPTLRRVLDFTHKQLLQNRLTGLSEIQRRQNYLFPCQSECSSSDIPCRKKSVFSSGAGGDEGESAIHLSQNITRECRFVLYMADFSRTLTDIPLVQDNPDSAWPRDTLCQIAFVSDSSSVVQSAVHEEKKNQPEENLHTSELNGKLIHNNWHLIWVNHNISKSEADYMMPKIAPGIFFSRNVTRAMYVEPVHLHSLPPLNAIWYMMAKQLDSKKRQKRLPSSKRTGTALGRSMTSPFIPAKHVALFVHEPATDDVNQASGLSVDSLAKFVLQQKGKAAERAEWPRRQFQLYEDSFFDKTYYGGDDFELVDTFLMIHQFSSDRSKRLRCEWYEEQLFWSNHDITQPTDEGHNDLPILHRNRDLEDLSLSFVLASWRRDGRLVPNLEESQGTKNDDIWGERIIDVSIGDAVEEEEEVSMDGDEDPLPSQYFVKTHPSMRARKRYF